MGKSWGVSKKEGGDGGTVKSAGSQCKKIETTRAGFRKLLGPRGWGGQKTSGRTTKPMLVPKKKRKIREPGKGKLNGVSRLFAKRLANQEMFPKKKRKKALFDVHGERAPKQRRIELANVL